MIPGETQGRELWIGFNLDNSGSNEGQDKGNQFWPTLLFMNILFIKKNNNNKNNNKIIRTSNSDKIKS